MTHTLDPDDAQEIACVSSQHVASQEVSRHRWYTKRLIVFEFEDDAIDGLFGFYYLDPATECQDGQERFEADPVPVFSVKSRDVVTIAYEPA